MIRTALFFAVLGLLLASCEKVELHRVPNSSTALIAEVGRKSGFTQRQIDNALLVINAMNEIFHRGAKDCQVINIESFPKEPGLDRLEVWSVRFTDNTTTRYFLRGLPDDKVNAFIAADRDVRSQNLSPSELRHWESIAGPK